MSLRAFTVPEANALIPELETILSGVRQRNTELHERHEQIQILDALWGEKLSIPGTPDHDEFVEHRQAIERLAAEIEAVVDEQIISRGIRFPQGGLEHGLLDFPTTLDGRWVYLCWHVGEPRIVAWHEVDGGYAGRRPLTEEDATRMGRAESGEPGSGA
jgi:hypothetical protein